MNNQDVLNTLSDIEEFFFYKKNNPQDLEAFQSDLAQMYSEVKELLLKWHMMTGCKIEY